MPPDSDWVLQSMFNDKTLMRNMLPYTLCREANGSAGAVRGQFVEVFFNQDGGAISYDPSADQQSWTAMLELFDEVFG